MQSVTVDILDGLPDCSENPWLLLPRPIDDWQHSYQGLTLSGISELQEVVALNSAQRAYLIKPEICCSPGIRFHFAKKDNCPPPWFWQQQDNRYTRAADDLTELAQRVTAHCDNPEDALQRLMEHAAGIFGYGHRDRPLYDEEDEISCVCGGTRGSCVDINTYLMAAATSLNIPVQYMAGYWFHPDRSETPGMHCWLVFEINDQPVFWDLAHHLKWGVTELAPGLNPAGGCRVTMSCGRGLLFNTSHGSVEISHFSKPTWILSGARVLSPQLKITLQESD